MEKITEYNLCSDCAAEIRKQYNNTVGENLGSFFNGSFGEMNLLGSLFRNQTYRKTLHLQKHARSAEQHTVTLQKVEKPDVPNAMMYSATSYPIQLLEFTVIGNMPEEFLKTTSSYEREKRLRS